VLFYATLLVNKKHVKFISDNTFFLIISSFSFLSDKTCNDKRKEFANQQSLHSLKKMFPKTPSCATVTEHTYFRFFKQTNIFAKKPKMWLRMNLITIHFQEFWI